MKLQGRHTFDAPREAVWKALNDPEVLARTLPGCERLEETEPHVYAGTLDIQVGPVSGKFQGKVELRDLEENRGYHLSLDGQGAPGFVQGKGSVELEDGDGGGTVLIYDLDAQVGGRIAGVGQRLLDSSAKVVARQALEGLEAQIAARAGAVQAGEAAPGAAREGSAAPTPSPAAPSQTLFAARFARGLFEELVPAPWRPVVVGGGVLLLLAVVVLLVRACSG
jgi:carbon monoxide dehydrogenase subunit G